jgi:hypothetical protein
MAKGETALQTFVRKMKNLEPNTPYVYFTGESLAFTRTWRQDVDFMGKFARACLDLGYGQLFQRRNQHNPKQFDHIIVLHEKLGMRKDGNGRYQEAERLALEAKTVLI